MKVNDKRLSQLIDGLQDGDIIAHYGGFADNQASGVIEHDSKTHSGGGMNIYAEFRRHPILEKQRERLTPLPPQPMGNPVSL